MKKPQSLVRVKRFILDILLAQIAARKRHAVEKNTLIFSDGRGGSTWLTEVLASQQGAAVLWEPLFPPHAPRVSDLGFDWWPYLPESDANQAAEEYFESLFSGQILNYWIASASGPLRLWQADRLITKFCLGKPLLPWITRKFEFQRKPILLLRHPFAVVASQLEHGAWDYSNERFFVPSGPNKQIYQQHAEYLSSLETKVEALTATWCINNQVPLSHARNGLDWLPVYYEHLLARPAEELENLFQQWGEEFPAEILPTVSRASRTTKDASFQAGIEKQLGKWTKQLSQSQQSRMTDVLAYFDVEVYGTDLMPQV